MTQNLSTGFGGQSQEAQADGPEGSRGPIDRVSHSRSAGKATHMVTLAGGWGGSSLAQMHYLQT